MKLLTLSLIALSSVYLSACSETATEKQEAPPPVIAPPELSETQQKVSEVLSTTSDIVNEKTEQAVAATSEISLETKEKLSEVSSQVLDHTANAAEKVAEKAKALKADVDAKAQQAELQKLAQQHGCLSCHAIDKKLIGPAYRDVAAKYAGQSDAQQQLITSISKGSSGKWGTMAMPANSPRVNDADIEKLAGWVLSQK